MKNPQNDNELPNPAKLPLYLGPYENWNYGEGKAYAFPTVRNEFIYISALAQLPNLDNKAKSISPGSTNESDPRSWIPTLWWNDSADYQFTFLPFVFRYPLIQELTPENLAQAQTKGFADFVGQLFPKLSDERVIENARFRLAFPVNSDAMNTELVDLPTDPEWEAEDGLMDRVPDGHTMTVVAVIDDGIPFAHQNFYNASGTNTRIEFCWLQSAPLDNSEKKGSVLFGRELTRQRIDKLITDYGDDEDFLYHVSGAASDLDDTGNATNRRSSHGAHIMDIATGFRTASGDVPKDEIRVIAVQLPDTMTLDTSGFGRDMYILSAFHYIFNRAELISKKYGVDNLRLVVNFSYGYTGGRHDGRSEIELAVEELVAARRAGGKPTAVVIPSGNTFVDRLHGVIGETDFIENKFSFNWRIQPNDRTPNYLEIWFPSGFDPSGYFVLLTDPSGLNSQKFEIRADSANDIGDPHSIEPIYTTDGPNVGQISADKHNNDRWRLLMIIAPTEPEDDTLSGASSGIWNISLNRTQQANSLEKPVRCWVQRDTEIVAQRTGSKQSYLDDLAYEVFDDHGAIGELDCDQSFVQRFGSNNGIATGSGTLTVGGFRASAEFGENVKRSIPSVYSSAGPINSATAGEKVDCSSLSDRSTILPGTIAAGTRSGVVSQLQGTSAAAPTVTRQLAAAFVTNSDDDIKKTENENYLRLLECLEVPDDDPLVTRLGKCKIIPERQPGMVDPD